MTICSFANTSTDTTFIITSSQLKCANLIFVEHKKLSIENILLKEQVKNYSKKSLYLEEIDSIRQNEILEYETQIKDLNTTIKRKNQVIKAWKVGCFTVSLGVILLLIFK